MKSYKNNPVVLSPLIVFDGVCVLCNRWVNYVLEKDQQQLFIFSSYQGLPTFISKKGVSIPLEQSIALYDNGAWFQQSTAILLIFKKLYGRFHWSQLAWIAPRFLRDFLYRQVAKRRYQWFGKTESCRVPNQDEANRFIG
jgi:predicted DCC family thiol-disulfide oxidoreductase YuxK